MRAALVSEVKQPIEFSEVATPVLNHDEVLIKVEVCGLCHTDLHIVDGHWKLPLLPIIPGHEVVGTISAIGDGVKIFTLGARVGVAWLHRACQVCDHCIDGYEMQCEQQDNTGYTVHGGFAEYIKAPANFVINIPASLSSTAAATLLCAGVTPYRALKESGARCNQLVAIFGIGGLGHLAVQLAKTMGFKVVAVDVSEEKLALARRFGADMTVNAAQEPPAKFIRKLGGAHAAINLVATGKTMEEAFYSLRRCGTLVVVGLPREEFTLPVIPFVGRGVKIVGTVVGTRQDLHEVLALAAEGKVVPLVTERPMSEINQAFEDMRAGRIEGRYVLRVE